MDNSVDNCNIGRTADIFSLGQAIENIGWGVLVTGVIDGNITLYFQIFRSEMALAKREKRLHLVPVRHRYARHRATRALLNQSTGLILTTSCKDVPPTDETILGNSGTLGKAF